MEESIKHRLEIEIFHNMGMIPNQIYHTKYANNAEMLDRDYKICEILSAWTKQWNRKLPVGKAKLLEILALQGELNISELLKKAHMNHISNSLTGARVWSIEIMLEIMQNSHLNNNLNNDHQKYHRFRNVIKEWKYLCRLEEKQ